MTLKLKNGQPSTLATYRELALKLSGAEDSPAVQYFDQKIAEQGPDMEIEVDEGQMSLLIFSMLVGNS